MRWIVRLDTVVELVVVVAQHGGRGWMDRWADRVKEECSMGQREREEVAAALGTIFYWLVGSTSA